MPKKLFWIFLMIILLLAAAGIVHTAIVYVSILNSAGTGFPVEAAFLFLIPYAIAIALVGLIWLIVYAFLRKNAKRQWNK